MTNLLPWLLLFFLLFFCGLFFLVFFSLRSQERALEIITRQQEGVRRELERLADSLNELVSDHELEDRDVTPSGSEEAAPGLERLLLAPPEGGSLSSGRERGTAEETGLPDLRI